MKKIKVNVAKADILNQQFMIDKLYLFRNCFTSIILSKLQCYAKKKLCYYRAFNYINMKPFILTMPYLYELELYVRMKSSVCKLHGLGILNLQFRCFIV